MRPGARNATKVRRKTLVLCAAGILGLFVCLPLQVRGGIQAASGSQTELEELSTRAVQAQQRADFRGAAEAYEEILKLQPSLTPARLNLGLMQFSMKDFAAAIPTFEIVLHESPDSLPGNLFMGLSLLGQQEPERALPYLKRAQSLDPRNIEALLALGQACSLLRDYVQANRWYFQLAQIEPKSADAWFGLGVSYLELGTRIAHIDSASPYSHLLMAESLEQQSRLDDAISRYKELATIDPLFPCYRATVGLGLAHLDEIRSAEALFHTELNEHPGCGLARLGLARVSIEDGNFPQATSTLEDLWVLDSTFIKANMASALAGLALQRRNEFLAWLEEAKYSGANGSSGGLANWLKIALKENDPGQGDGNPSETSANGVFRPENIANARRLFAEGRYTQCAEILRPSMEKLALSDLLVLARCAYYSGDYRTSFLSSGRAIKVGPTNLEGSYWRVRTAGKLGSDSLLRASVLSPNSTKMHIVLGDTYREMQHFSEAEVEYRKAIQSAPMDFASHFGLALNFYQAFQMDKAEDELKTVMELRPEDPDASYLMGCVLVSKQEFDAAKPLLLAGLKGNPNNVPHVYAMLGKIDAAQGNLKEARAEFEKSLGDDGDGSYHYQLFRVCKRLGDNEAAAANLAQSRAIAIKRQASPQPEVPVP